MSWSDVLGGILLLFALYLVIWHDIVSFFFDIRVDQDGIDFIFFRMIRISRLLFVNIEKVEPTTFGFGHPFAFMFISRPRLQAFLIRKKNGWFTRQIVVTPKDSEEFLAQVRQAGVNVQ